MNFFREGNAECSCFLRYFTHAFQRAFFAFNFAEVVSQHSIFFFLAARAAATYGGVAGRAYISICVFNKGKTLALFGMRFGYAGMKLRN